MNEPARIVETKIQIKMYGVQVMENLYESENYIDPFESMRSYIYRKLMSTNIKWEEKM
jgi:hypothetical protein